MPPVHDPEQLPEEEPVYFDLSRYIAGGSKLEEDGRSSSTAESREAPYEHIADLPTAGVLTMIFTPLVALDVVALFTRIGWARHWAIMVCLNWVYLMVATMIMATKESGMTAYARKRYAEKLFVRLVIIAVVLGIIGFILLWILLSIISSSDPRAFD